MYWFSFLLTPESLRPSKILETLDELSCSSTNGKIHRLSNFNSQSNKVKIQSSSSFVVVFVFLSLQCWYFTYWLYYTFVITKSPCSSDVFRDLEGLTYVIVVKNSQFISFYITYNKHLRVFQRVQNSRFLLNLLLFGDLLNQGEVKTNFSGMNVFLSYRSDNPC